MRRLYAWSAAASPHRAFTSHQVTPFPTLALYATLVQNTYIAEVEAQRDNEIEQLDERIAGHQAIVVASSLQLDKCKNTLKGDAGNLRALRNEMAMLDRYRSRG